MGALKVKRVKNSLKIHYKKLASILHSVMQIFSKVVIYSSFPNDEFCQKLALTLRSRTPSFRGKKLPSDGLFDLVPQTENRSNLFDRNVKKIT
jgi:hypothetical protein